MQVLMGEVESKKGGVGRRASTPQLTVTAYNRAVVIKSSNLQWPWDNGEQGSETAGFGMLGEPELNLKLGKLKFLECCTVLNWFSVCEWRGGGGLGG